MENILNQMTPEKKLETRQKWRDKETAAYHKQKARNKTQTKKVDYD